MKSSKFSVFTIILIFFSHIAHADHEILATIENGDDCITSTFENGGHGTPVHREIAGEITGSGLYLTGWATLLGSASSALGNLPSGDTAAMWQSGTSANILFNPPVSEASLYFATLPDITVTAFDEAGNTISSSNGISNVVWTGGPPLAQWDLLSVSATNGANSIASFSISQNGAPGWIGPGLTVIDNLKVCRASAMQLACEIEIERDHDQTQSVAESLELKTYNSDPEQENIWQELFAVTPAATQDATLILQGENRTVTWEAGTLEMGGTMKLKIKTDKHDPALKTVSIEKVGGRIGTTTFIHATGGINPAVADGGWHEVEVENMQQVTAHFDGHAITGYLKELKVSLDKSSSLINPVVKRFKLKIKGSTAATRVKRGTVSSVTVHVPATTVTIKAGSSFEGNIKDEPIILSGHTKAEYETDENAVTSNIDISTLLDGNNDRLEERKGICLIK